MAALLEDPAPGEDDDVVGHPDRGEPVRDQDRHPVFGNLPEMLEDRASAAASIDAVGSSSTRMSAPARMNARDSATFCHWPSDSSRPPLNQRPSCVR